MNFEFPYSIPLKFDYDLPQMPSMPSKLPFELPKNFPIDDKLIIISLVSLTVLITIVSILTQIWNITKTLVLLIVLVFSLIIPIVTLLYIFKLEDPNCNCIKDWRIDFIKYWTVISLTIGFIITLTGNVYLGLLLTLINAINVYALFTYVGDLNKEKCNCIIGNLSILNNFLYYWRYLMVVGVFFSLLASIWRLSVIAESKKHPHFVMIPNKN